MNDYFIKGFYSDEVYAVLAEKNDFRVAIVNGLYAILLFCLTFNWKMVLCKLKNQPSFGS